MSSKIETLETLFKALADTTRLRILWLLLNGEVCVCDIHESLGIPQPKASRHLAYLRRAGLVLARKEGLWMHYRLEASDDAVVRTIVDAVTHCLGHVPDTVRDSERLRAKTGCCESGESLRPDLACCGEGQAMPAPMRVAPRPASRD